MHKVNCSTLFNAFFVMMKGLVNCRMKKKGFEKSKVSYKTLKPGLQRKLTQYSEMTRVGEVTGLKQFCLIC